MASGRDTEIGARSQPRGRKARGSAPTALTAPHPARSEPLRQAGQRVFNSVGPGARLSRSTGSRILRGGHHGGLNSRRRQAFPKTALTDADRSKASSLPSGGQQTTLATLLSVPRKAFPLFLLVHENARSSLPRMQEILDVMDRRDGHHCQGRRQSTQDGETISAR
jgi:hypothetical protein